MNVSYAVAVEILDRAAMIQQFSPRRVVAEDVWTLIPNITVRHETAFDGLGLTAQGQARVTVHFTDGMQLQSFIPVSKAMTEPMSEERIVTKFRTLTHNIVAPERKGAIIRAVLGVEELHSVSELTAILAPGVGVAFE
jgi:aconitate decarboxylase